MTSRGLGWFIFFSCFESRGQITGIFAPGKRLLPDSFGSGTEVLMSIARTCRENLLAIATAYARATGLTLAQVSKRFYGKGSFLGEFKRRARSVSVDKFDELVDQFRADWPEGARWPYTHAATIEPPNHPQKKGRKSGDRAGGHESNRLTSGA
jgi:hypothetical protein